MDSSTKSSNKIRDIVRLQQILKKWKKLANNNRNNNINNTSGGGSGSNTTTNPSSGMSRSGSSKSIKFLKKTLSFSETTNSSSSSSSSSACTSGVVPKGYIAVCVGKELKRFVVPTEYLGHQAFAVLLREAEEEFGFQQEGVLKFPCEVEVFEKILKLMEVGKKKSSEFVLVVDDHNNKIKIKTDFNNNNNNNNVTAYCGNMNNNNNYSPEVDLTDCLNPSLHQPQLVCQ